MTIFSSELLGWNLLSSHLLIGAYYGILSTLPLAPSQLLSIRVLLLEDENKQDKIIGAGAAKGIFIAGVSGFLIAQFAMFLSIYSSSLYTVWFKPHLLNFFLPPFLLWHYFRIIEFDPVAHLIPNYKHPLFDPRVRTAFIESFLLQIINPMVLPNPVFTRLMSIFLFKYSHVPMFIFGSLIGWLSGQLLFVVLSWMLLSRLQLDSPAIYRIVKRIVHWAFPPIIMGIFLSYMGRVSMIPFYKKTQRKKNILLHQLWPDLFYNRDRTSRLTHFMLSSNQSTVRNQTNAPFNISNISLHKNHFSQYFFSTSLSDGKSRLSHTYPVSLSLIQNNLKTIINLTHEPDLIKQQWNQRKEVRLFSLNNVLNKKINQLDHQSDSNLQKKLNSISDSTIKIRNLSQYIKKKITYSNELSQCIRKYINSHHSLTKRIRKSYDTRLGNDLRKQPNIIKNESPWLINQQQDLKISPKKNRHYLTRWKVNNLRLNRLKKIAATLNIYTSYHDAYKKVPTWKSKGRSLYSSYFQFQFFKKNLTRRRRRKFFFRSFFLGATSGRSRNNAGTVFQFLENQPRSLFFLRANEISIKNKENLNSTQRISQTESEKFDFSSSHSVRGPALITQAFIRKYIKLPTLILGKSLIRLLLIHSSEWEQDWMEWNREKYIYCYYNGNFASNDQMPLHWLGDGLQIKILSPFHLTPWRPSLYHENSVLETKNPILSKSSYINIWGQETDVPFGEIQSTPFLKPIIKALILFWRYQLAKILKIYHRTYCNMKEKFFFTKNHFVKKIDILHNQIDSDKNISNYLDKKFDLANDSSQISLNELQQVNSSLKEALLSKDNIIYNQNNTVITLKNSIIDDQTNLVTHGLIENKNIHLEKVNDLDKKNYDFIGHEIKHYNVPIFQTIKNKKHTRFPRQLIFTKKNRFMEYQKTKIKMYLIQLNQKFLFIKKLVFRTIIRMIRIMKQRNLELKQNIIFINIKFITSFNDYLCLIQRCLVNLLTKGILLNIENHNYSMNNTNNNNDLSHAYILHKIWQNNVPNRLSIKDVIMQWKGKNSLHDHIKMILMQYGFLQDKPEDININNLKEWLRPFRRYTPSPKIWYHISPNHWSNQVTELWEKKTLFIPKFQYRSNFMLDPSMKYLSYYKPLFEYNKQIFKRWQNSLLMNSYMNAIKNDHLIDLLSGWQTKDRENNQLINLQLITENLNKKNNILTSEKLTWGSTNTRNNSLVISFPLIKLFNKSLISKKKYFISKKQPIYFKYENTLGLEKNELFFLKKRVSFRPIIQYRWKSEKDRFKVLNSIDILRKAKSDFKNAMQNAMLAKKHNLKSASVLADKAKEATLQWKTLNLLTFTCQCIKKRQAKILDDEILMHSMITSFLNFKKKYLSVKNIEILNSAENNLFSINQHLSTQCSLMPEDLLLVKTLREYRILSSFNFNGDSDINKTIHFLQVDDLTKNHTIKDTNILPIFNHTEAFSKISTEFDYNQTIQRYLWPSYRIEDLACMNRFWINTANQSRFSSLRIRIYPNLIV